MKSLLAVLVIVVTFSCISCDDNEEGKYFEGDMDLTDRQKLELQMSIDGVSTFGASTYRNWPRNIPIYIDPKLVSEPTAVSAIAYAITDFHQHTCLRFHIRGAETAYLNFMLGTGCSSPVGYHGRTNNIKLASGCWTKGIVIHEIMHSLGFFHEQSRPDRDHYVTINWHNIPIEKQHNFRKYDYGTIKSGNSPYDYNSVMHYRRTAFGNGKVTVDPIFNYWDDKIGQRNGFSAYDIQQIKDKYNC